jgi:hypothetical protein
MDFRGRHMSLVRKPFAEFAAELEAGLRAGRGDEPIAESATFKVVEVAPGDWRLQMIFDHAVEVVGDESFPTREAAVEEIVDRLEACADLGRRSHRAHPVRATSAPAQEAWELNANHVAFMSRRQNRTSCKSLKLLGTDL